MIIMLQLANIPASVLPPQDKTYTTSNDWYTALSEMHFCQLIFQHKKLVFTEDDCRNKFISRLLFRRLAKNGQFSIFGFLDDTWSSQSKTLSEEQKSDLLPAPKDENNFRLWCDDLRGGNILMGENEKIAAIIDWEFSYSGSAQFVLDPPWWILLEEQERWDDGIDAWTEIYSRRLGTWLKVMDQAEQNLGVNEEEKLSLHMKQSWDTGRF